MMQDRRPDLSIVIVSYNVRDLLARCLESLLSRQTTDISGESVDSSVQVAGQRSEVYRLQFEVFVVDNASSDASADLVRSRYPSVQLIANAENLGFAAANNQAFGLARGRYILMLNPDTAVRPLALDRLVEFMDGHPRAGACGGKLLYADGTLQHSAFRFPSLAQIWLDFFPLNWRLHESRLNGRYPRAWYARGEPFQVDHLLGADLTVRREAAEQVGWLDERFFIYCEEIDWCLRLRRAGWQVWLVPKAEIVHYEAQSTRQFRDVMFVELWRARAKLFEKHYSPVFRRLAGIIVRLGLASLTRQARAAEKTGRISHEEMTRRLGAFAQVARLQA